MKRKWFSIVPLILCALVFFGYRIYDGLRTDTQPPQITITETQTPYQVFLSQGSDALLQGVRARDDRDGDVTESLLVESMTDISADHTVTVTYAAFDRSGNVAKQERQVLIADYESPRFTLDAPLAFVFGSNFDALADIGAQDLLDGDISHRVRATLMDDVTITAEGTHDVLFRVTNSLGDTSQLIIPVEVYHGGRYDGLLTLKNYLIYLPKGTPFDPQTQLKSLLLFGQETDLTLGLPEDLTLQILGTVDSQQPGVYTLDYLLSSTRGNQVYESYSRLVVVVEE